MGRILILRLLTRGIIPAGLLILLSGCIGDDLISDEVEPEIRILNPVVSIEVGTTYQFEARFFNNVGIEDPGRELRWSSSETQILTIDDNGLARALALGTTIVSVETDFGSDIIKENLTVVVSGETVTGGDTRSGVIVSTSSYVLEGSFTLSGATGDLNLDIDASYKATSALPGLYLYLSNNPNSTADAYEVGAVEVFEGAHSYNIKDNVGLNDYDYLLYYCKPFNVKVGEGKIE